MGARVIQQCGTLALGYATGLLDGTRRTSRMSRMSRANLHCARPSWRALVMRAASSERTSRRPEFGHEAGPIFRACAPALDAATVAGRLAQRHRLASVVGNDGGALAGQVEGRGVDALPALRGLLLDATTE